MMGVIVVVNATTATWTNAIAAVAAAAEATIVVGPISISPLPFTGS
jgi:hypothetical protein